MTEITKKIWIGNSTDAVCADLHGNGISAMLNCAWDLQGERGHRDNVLYAQCGLVDGPGNSMISVHSAILQLVAMVSGGRVPLVYCHDGVAQSVFVTICTLHLMNGRFGYEYWREFINGKRELPSHKPDVAQRSSFDRINWRLLASVLER